MRNKNEYIFPDLEAEIGRSELSKTEIARRIGMCSASFCKKRAGIAPWTSGEIVAIRKLFNLSKEEAGRIFLD